MDPLLDRLLPRARPAVRRGALLAAVAVALLVLAVAVAIAAGGAAGSSAALPAIRTGGTVPTPTPTPLLVQVAGAVRHPGVVTLPPGARVLDAVAAAGGATARADTDAVPLAARVADGQRILVPVRGGTTPASSATASGGAPSGGTVSLAAATEAQLETLPRIGPALAARILAWRDAHGGFRTVADLQQVPGIGPKTFAGLKDLVTP